MMLRSLCLALNNWLRNFIDKLNNKPLPTIPENPSNHGEAQLLRLTVDVNDVEVQTEVDSKTVIGRRLLPDHFKKSADESETIILFQAFVDSRVTQSLSFDALGYSGRPDNAVINALRPIIKKHIELNSFNYVAWSGIKKKSIPDLKVYSTPDKTNPSNINDYHCDLDRADFSNKRASKALAYQLAVHANQDKIFIKVEP